MLKRWTTGALAILVLFASACSRNNPPSEEELEPAQSVWTPPADASQTQVKPQQDPEPAKPLSPTWEENRTLEDMPDDYNGLELPIQGATGYVPVELPLWNAPEDAEAAAQAVAEWEQAEAERLAQEQAQAQTPDGTSNPETQPPASTTAPDTSSPSSSTPPAAESDPSAAAPSAETQTEPAEDSSSIPDDASGTDSSEPSQTETDGTLDTSSAPDTAAEPAQPSETPDAAIDPSDPTAAAPGDGTEEPAVPTLTDGSITLLPPGTPFTVLQETGGWWQIAVEADYYEDAEQTVLAHGELTGWVEHKYCFVNLPDVIPSIIYDATNSYSSHFVSCGKRIPDVTGRAFYPSKTYNARLDKMEFMMPVLYSMARNLCAAQRNALAEGNSLILYEGYRPHEVQTKVLSALSAMSRADPEVKEAVSGKPWNISWFISGGYSNHQRGYAVDVGLAKVTATKEYSTGGLRYVRVWDFERYEMPTPIHELSRAAATFTAPVVIHSTTAWKSAELAPSMNEPALGLQRYCTQAGLTPLASEWWHFNDLEARSQVLENQGVGDFLISSVRSAVPGQIDPN